MDALPDKVCERCGASFSYTASTGRARWAARRFCGASCKNAWYGEHILTVRGRGGRRFEVTDLPAEKVCEECGTTFARRSLYHMPHEAWRKRRTCSAECWRTLLGRETHQRAVEGRHPAFHGDQVKSGRHRARALYPELGQCNRCEKPAQVRHHRDENTLSNAPENIEFLCRHCHMAHHKPGRVAA